MLDPNKTEIIVAAPGCGKTTTLLNRIEKALNNGVPPLEIAFFSFSNTAVNEGLDRIVQRLNTYKKKFKYFKTLHSMAFSMLGMSTDQILSYKMLKEFAKENDLKLASVDWRTGAIITQSTDSNLLSSIDSARMQGMTVREFFTTHHIEDIQRAEELAVKYQRFKLSRGVIDFTDMILLANQQDFETPHFQYMFIDEAQDLSKQQWMFVEKLSQNADNIIIVGDERQAIADFAGADVDTFLSIQGQVSTLDQSYRVPANICRLARKVEKHMIKTRGADWKARPRDFGEEVSGEVIRVTQIPAREMARGSWLVLTRTNAQLNEFKEYMMKYCNTLPTFFTVDGIPPIDTDVFKAIDMFEISQKYPVQSKYDFIMPDITDDEDRKKKKKDWIKLFKRFINSKEPYSDNIDSMFAKRFNFKNWCDAFDKLPILERKYIKMMREAYRKNPDGFKNAKIKLSTIHSAKGMEADNVLLYTVLTGKVYKEWQEYKDTNDTEVKVLFVGITRARKRLFLLDGVKSKYTYEELLR